MKLHYRKLTHDPHVYEHCVIELSSEVEIEWGAGHRIKLSDLFMWLIPQYDAAHTITDETGEEV